MVRDGLRPDNSIGIELKLFEATIELGQVVCYARDERAVKHGSDTAYGLAFPGRR